MRAPASLLLAALLLAGCGDDGDESTGGVALADAQRAEAARLGMPAEFTNSLGMRFVLVPRGAFSMRGRDASEVGTDERHDVRLFGSYYVQDREVTTEQWARLEAEGHREPDAPVRPVTGVSQEEAATFAAHLTAQDPQWIYRLPTEAEWEHGAPYPTVGGSTSAPAEWCLDAYQPLPSWEVMNPCPVVPGADRVTRGGSTEPLRGHADPARRDASIGFRLVALLSYGKSGLGARTVTFRTIDGDERDPAAPEHPGFEVHVVAVIDRLTSRQEGRDHLPWVPLPGLSNPVVRRMPPGRYYAVAVEPGNSTEFCGIETKFEVDDSDSTVLVRVPRPGAIIKKPQ